LNTRAETLVMQGSIRMGLDLALGSLIADGDKVLTISNGFWGDYIHDGATAHGARAVKIEGPIMEPIDPALVAAALEAHPDAKIVTMVHIETNAGIVNPVDAVGRLVAKTGAVFLVDTACSAGAIPVETDAWSIDVSVTGAHKTLGGLPGLAVLTVSDKAWAKIGRVSRQAFPGHFNLRRLFDANVRRGAPPGYTQPTSLVQALRASLDEIECFGVDNWFAEHERVAKMMRADLRAAGFAIISDEARRAAGQPLDAGLAPSVITVAYPAGIDGAQFRKSLEQDYGIFVIGNVGELKDRSFRIGLMSPVQMHASSLRTTLAAMVAAAGRLRQ